MVSSDNDPDILPFRTRITLLLRSGYFILCPLIPAKNASDYNEVPSSLPLWPSHGNDRVSLSIPQQYCPESNIKDEEDESYTEGDIKKYLKSTEQKKTRVSKSRAQSTTSKSKSSKQQPESDDDVDGDLADNLYTGEGK